MTDAEIFAQRLKQARILKKFSMEKLANLIGGLVTKQAISKYESAKMLPNSSVLLALSSALDVEPDYFYRPYNYDFTQFDISFRKKSNSSTKDINAIKVKIQDEVERYLEIEEILGIRNNTPNDFVGPSISSSEDMCNMAIELRKAWNLGCNALANVQDILEAHNIKVISTEAPSCFDGVSGTINTQYYIIVLNSNRKHIERRRFTALHELGHLLYNKHFSKNLTQREKERLCDEFASEMLLPSSTLLNTFNVGEKISTTELKQIQTMYGISIDAIMYKLKRLGVISENKYQSYCIQKNKNTSFKTFVEQSRYKETITNKFEALVYAAIAKDLISISKAAYLLHSSVNTINKQLNII